MTLLFLASFMANTAKAGVLEQLKAEAIALGFTFSSTSNYWTFRNGYIVVNIPTDITTTREADLAFESGFASASATYYALTHHK